MDTVARVGGVSGTWGRDLDRVGGAKSEDHYLKLSSLCPPICPENPAPPACQSPLALPIPPLCLFLTRRPRPLTWSWPQGLPQGLLFYAAGGEHMDLHSHQSLHAVVSGAGAVTSPEPRLLEERTQVMSLNGGQDWTACCD